MEFPQDDNVVYPNTEVIKKGKVQKVKELLQPSHLHGIEDVDGVEANMNDTEVHHTQDPNKKS